MHKTLAAVAAYDILADGTARPLEDAWPAPGPADGAAWRWLHCDRSTPAFAAWSKEHLPRPVRAGLLQAETRPHCEVIGDGHLVTLRGMNLNPGEEAEDMVAIRLWIGQGLVVSTRLRRVFAMDEIRADMDAGQSPLTPGAFVARLADELTRRIETASAEREEATDEIEEELLDDRPDILGPSEIKVSRLARSVIKIRRYIAPQREALSQLAATKSELIGASELYELRSIANRTTRAIEELDTVRDRLASLRAHIDSLHAAQLGRNGFVLSVAATIFLPLGFLTGLLGMNVGGMPGTDWPWAFVAVTAGMAALGLGLWLLFRWLKWF